MKTVWNVLKKEILNIVRNRRRLFMMVLFNLILLPSITVIPLGLITSKTVQAAVQKLEIPVQGIEYAPELMSYIESGEYMTTVAAEDVQKLVRERQALVGLIIPSDFEERLQNGETAQIQVVIDKSKSLSVEGERLKSIVGKYNQIILQERLKKNNISAEYLMPVEVQELNTATDQETAGSQLSLLIPGFIISFGLTSGLSMAISTIAGEKQEQTLEPVLFTPVNRSALVFGKLLAVLVNILFAAISFVVAILFSLLMFVLVIFYLTRGNAELTSAAPAIANALPFANAFASLPDSRSLLFFLLSILPVILLGAALQIMISSIARNSDEAFTFSIPLSILSLIPFVAAFFLDEFVPSLGHYAIPIFGTILSMRDLLSNHIYTNSLSLMFISSIGYAALTVGFSVWLFNREEVVFRA